MSADKVNGTTERQQQEPLRQFAAPLRLDRDSAAGRLLEERIGDELAAIPAHHLVPPISEGVRRAYAGALENFRSWCVLEGLVAEPSDVSSLPLEALRRAIEGWLAWRVTAVDEDHPLVGRRFGQRSAAPLSKLDPLRSALVWWAASEGLGPVLSSRAVALTGVAAPPSPARELTDTELAAIVEVLLANEVVEGTTPKVTAAWHARQLAMINIALATSLRPTAEIVMLADRNVMSASEELIEVRLTRTKLHPEGRVVGLHRRDDALCPIWALTRFLAICRSAGWSRAGYLLPSVRHDRYQPLSAPVGAAAARKAMRRITDHLGIFVDLDTGLKATPHGLRAMGPTRAFAKGMDIRDVQRLGGWQTMAGVLRYDRRAEASEDFTGAMADDMTGDGLL